MTKPTGTLVPCAGVWYRWRNECRCACCRRMNATRSAYIDAAEAVHRVALQGGSVADIALAEVKRDTAADRWRATATRCYPRAPPDAATVDPDPTMTREELTDA